MNQACLTPIIPQFLGVLDRETEAGAQLWGWEGEKDCTVESTCKVCSKNTDPKNSCGFEALSGLAWGPGSHSRL